MKKFLCILLVLLLSSFSALAEAFDPTVYSYEELLLIRESVEETILALETQYAIENGNREIQLGLDQAVIFKGKTLKLTPTVRRVVEDAPEKTTLVYASSDPAVAKVSSNGTITAVAAGDCVITCSAKDDEHIFATLPVHVALKVSSVTLDAKTATLLVSPADPAAAQMQLTATVAPENAHVPTVTWKSSDESIATVDANGSVQAHAPGTVTITATSDDEVAKDQKAKSASCKITVLRAVDSLVLSQDTAVVYNGTTLTLTAAVQPGDASQQTVAWESSDPEIATVTAKGAVKGVKAGTATITATAADGSGAAASCQVQVVQRATGVEMSQETAVLLLGGEESASRTQLTAAVAPDNAYVPTVTWTSSDESVATVDENGNVQAHSAGTATITATSQDEPVKGKKAPAATCKVTVRQAVTSISLASNITLNKGSRYTLKPTVLPETATLRTVEWHSTNSDVVAVSANGQLTAKDCGFVHITCTAKDGSEVYATCYVNVIQMVESLKPTYTKVGVTAGETKYLATTVRPFDATNPRLKWTSSNTSVATVEDGVVTGHRTGTATITVSTTDGSDLSSEITVTVEPVNGVELLTMWRKTRWGMPTSIAIEVRNNNQMRTIKSFEYVVTCYSVQGKKLGTSYCTWNGSSLRPGAEATSKYDNVSGLTYAQKFEIRITSITYADGTYEILPSSIAESGVFSW